MYAVVGLGHGHRVQNTNGSWIPWSLHGSWSCSAALCEKTKGSLCYLGIASKSMSLGAVVAVPVPDPVV